MPVSATKPAALLPEWLKPENASVMDPAYRAPLRTLMGFLGLDDPNQIMGTATPLMTLAPRVPAAELVDKLAPIGKVSTEVRAAVQHLVDRFPRLMSHVSAINPAPLSTEERAVSGRVLPEIIAKVPRLAADAPEGAGMRAPVALIQYDPQVIKGNELGTLAHEATHVAQMTRGTDVARRIPTEPTFNEIYDRMSKAQGYYNNPYEVAAREASDSVLLKKARVFEPRNVAKAVFDATGDPAAVESRLRMVFPSALDSELTTALRAATGDPKAVMTPLPPMPSRR